MTIPRRLFLARGPPLDAGISFRVSRRRCVVWPSLDADVYCLVSSNARLVTPLRGSGWTSRRDDADPRRRRPQPDERREGWAASEAGGQLDSPPTETGAATASRRCDPLSPRPRWPRCTSTSAITPRSIAGCTEGWTNTIPSRWRSTVNFCGTLRATNQRSTNCCRWAGQCAVKRWPSPLVAPPRCHLSLRTRAIVLNYNGNGD